MDTFLARVLEWSYAVFGAGLRGLVLEHLLSAVSARVLRLLAIRVGLVDLVEGLKELYEDLVGRFVKLIGLLEHLLASALRLLPR